MSAAHRHRSGQPANFLVLDADTRFQAVHQPADVRGSICNGEYPFKRPEPGYEIELDSSGRRGKRLAIADGDRVYAGRHPSYYRASQ